MGSPSEASAELSVLVRAWSEARELEGMTELLRGSLEVLGPGHIPRYWASVSELHSSLDDVISARYPRMGS
jgi:hypothetical protein